MYKSKNIQDNTLCVLKLGCDQFCFKELFANFINDSLFPFEIVIYSPHCLRDCIWQWRRGPGPGRLDSVLSGGYNSQQPSIVNFCFNSVKACPARLSPPLSHVYSQLSLVLSPGECRMSHVVTANSFPATVPPTLKPLSPSLPLSVCLSVLGNNNDSRPENGSNFKKCTQLFDNSCL